MVLHSITYDHNEHVFVCIRCALLIAAELYIPYLRLL
jgi:hypothetical protein